MTSVGSDFAKQFIIAIVVAVVVTVVVLTLVCVFAQCGPRMFGRVDRKERWFSPTLEEGQVSEGQVSEGHHSELPLVAGNSHPEKLPS